MRPSSFASDPADLFSARKLMWWRMAQLAVWLLGCGIVAALLWRPALGIQLMWNVLIPVAPLLLVLAGGIWRNVCPLATTALLPRRMGFSRKEKMPAAMQARLQLAGVVLLLLVVPLRHVVFNTNGWATGVLLVLVSSVAVWMGYRYEWKSGWCSGLCPVHPVEKLYSMKVGVSVPNAHCTRCANCMAPCPDSTPGLHLHAVKKYRSQRLSALLMTGAFPGFVWGWFQTPDLYVVENAAQVVSAYLMPLLGGGVTLGVYCLACRLLPAGRERWLTGVAAAAAVSCYYWYRIPALLGFGAFPGDGLLFDLRGYMPAWSATALAAVMVLFLFWWMVLRQPEKRSWAIRPEFE